MRSDVANSFILRYYLRPLCLGKNDFDAIEGFRTDAFFIRSLFLKAVPFSPRLRQRLNARAQDWFDLVAEPNTTMLGSRINGQPIDFGSLPCGYSEELVGRTYTGVDGYCSLAAYLDTNGYCLELALRRGYQYSAIESEYNLVRVLPMAASFVDTPLLVRADSGFCSLKLMQAN